MPKLLPTVPVHVHANFSAFVHFAVAVDPIFKHSICAAAKPNGDIMKAIVHSLIVAKNIRRRVSSLIMIGKQLLFNIKHRPSM